jgi:hypothetical protein
LEALHSTFPCFDIDTSFTTFDGHVLDLSPDEDPDIRKLLVNNRKWVENSKNSDPDFFKKIGGKQRPQYLYFYFIF